MTRFTRSIATATRANQKPRVPLVSFGKDHWSTFAYVETRCVDHKGVLDLSHMRTDAERHPGLIGDRRGNGGLPNTKFPTRLRVHPVSGTLIELADHDDWDCVDDLEAVGLLEWKCTGINPVFKLTSLGAEIAGQLRRHKALGKNFCEFTPRMPVEA